MKFAWIFPALLLFSLSSALALDAGEELQFFQKLHEDGLHEVALREMESSLSKNPGHELSHEIHHLASLSALALGELEKLSRHLQRFADLRPEDPRLCDLLFQSARECAREGRFELADPLIERLLREHPDCEEKGEVVYLSARIRHAQGNRPAALQLLAWIVENSSDSELLGKALYERADLRGEDNPQSAALDLEALKGSLPNHPLAGFASLRLAGIRHSQGETGKALDEIDWILSRFDEKELVLRALQRKADYLEEYGHLKEAASALGELQLRFPGRADSQVQAMREAELLLSAADPRKALLILGKAIRTHGSSSSLWILQSRTLDSLGKEGEAEASWRKSLELDLNVEQKRETLLALCETVFEDDPGSEYPVFHSDLFPLLDSARERSQSLLRLGLYFRNRDENMPALQAWELLEKEKSRASEYQESLYYRALLLAELERGAEGDFLLMKLQEEYGGSHWGLQARDHLESVARYERVLKEAAVEELVDILRSESKLSVAASLRLGRVFSEQLKDFPRAVAHFEALSESLEDLDESAHAAYEAGRVSALQSRKLVLAGDEKTALQWRERALEFFRWASRSSRPETLEGSDYERTLLELDRLEQGPEQMPFLDLYLESWPASPRSALLLSRRAEILLEQQSGDIEEERILAVLEDCRRSLTLDSSGAAAPATRLTLARASRKLNRMEDAEIQYRILLDQFSTRYEGVEARYGLGELAEKRKEFRTALTLFGEYESMAPGSSRIPRCLIHLGDCHFFLRNWEKARDYYRRIREEYPDNPFVDDTVFRSALAAERMGEGDAQRKDLVWLSQNGEERFRREALWRLAALPTEASSRQGVLQELLKLGWSGRYSEESAIELARGALDSGQGKEALALCDSLLTRTDSGENLPLLRSLRIRSLLQLDRGEEALAIWKSLEDASPLGEDESARVLLAFGRWHGKEGRLEEARRWFSLCLDRHGESVAAAEVSFETALIEARAGRYDRALSLFATLQEEHPGSPAAFRASVKAAGILFNRGDYEEASRNYELALSLEENPDADLLYWSSLALEKTGNPREALERIQSFLARYPEDGKVPEAMMKLGYFFQQLGQFDRALLAYRNAEFFQDREGKARLHFWIADCLEARGDLAEAATAFLKVSYLYNDQGMWGVTATLRSALLSEKLGDASQADRLFRKVLSSQGENSDFGRAAREGLERLAGNANVP